MGSLIYCCMFFAVACCGTGCWFYLRLRNRFTAVHAELKELQQRWASDSGTLREITKRNDRTEEFISTVSHELRTPLTSIRAALGLLSAGSVGNVDAAAARLLKIASSNTERLICLLNSILDLERLESGVERLSLRSCKVAELLEQVIDNMGPLALANSICLRVDSALNAAQQLIEADPDRILQVLHNLISNAVKFSPPGSTIVLIPSINASTFILRVVDCGRGIPEDKLETIFDRFGQADISDSRQKGGTGLGLAICREIVHQHGGKIRAENNSSAGGGQLGATFIMMLPLTQR